ncbi:MAG: hypothetical protein R3D00_08140 [Bacteroidia bacterium]
MPEGTGTTHRLLASERLQIKNRLFQIAFASLILSIFFLANTTNIREASSSDLTLSRDVDSGAIEVFIEDADKNSATENLIEGDILLFFQCPDYEWVKVSAVNGNRILLEKPLTRGYLSASRIEVMRVLE